MLFKICEGTLICYSQENLFIHVVSYVHNALEDVLSLQKLKRPFDIDVSACIFAGVSFTVLNACECWRYCSEVSKNGPTLNDLISEYVVSTGMANKIAGSGLNFSCFKLAYTRNLHDRISNLFSSI